MTAPGPRTDWLTRIVLGLVMAAALAVGTWSVYTLLREFLDAPRPIALLGCAMFDAAAFFFARLAQRYATTADSGFAPRAAMLVMISASAWVNWQHAALKGWGLVGSVVLAAAPVIAELAFEMWHRFEHREALRRRGRVAETLPVLGKWAWLTHPMRARRVVDAHIVARLTAVEAAAASDGADRITVMRDRDAAPHQVAAPPAPLPPQHVVIEVRQPEAIDPPAPASPGQETPEAQPEAPRATPPPPAARTEKPAPAPVPAPGGLAGIPKSEAVLRLKAQHPDASAPELVRRLAEHGITASDGYVRTALGRAKKRAQRDQGHGFYP